MSYQLLIVFSILGWGIGSFFYKMAGNTLHPFIVTTVGTCLFVLLTPLAFTFIKFDRSFTATGIGWALLGASFTCVGSLGYFFAMKTGGGAGEATTLTALYPAVTLLLSCLFLGEPFTVKKGIGITLALISCAILGWK